VFDPVRRLNALEALRHPWFDGVRRAGDLLLARRGLVRMDETETEMSAELLREAVFQHIQEFRRAGAEAGAGAGSSSRGSGH